MNADRTEKERIFHAAAELKTPNQRAAFLNAACGDDQILRAAVDELLRHDEEAGSFLDRPAVPAPAVATLNYQPIAEGVGSHIGPYKLLQQIGEGGFGVVYMAEQTEPVRRKVALKIIKPGMDTKEVIARFESERQALALMDHPNIARVFDAGATDSGRPYFVMELVKGVPITEYCDRNGLPTDQRLGLFVAICHAAQHAHQKGIIHRDIKPSNVMVTLHDGRPVPKVIDFGVAKATSQQLTQRTLFTQYGQMIGTPAYMSPEQAEMSGLDIDTRSDVYSLGVLLYELLTGSTPFDAKRLLTAGYAEMQRIIREEEPPWPSTRLSTLGASASVVSSHRGTDVKRLRSLLRGDLDVLVMKALEKDRNRRYETPNSFAADIERYLHHEAIMARPPSAAYQFRKYVQRNRVAVFLTLFIAATVVSVLFNHVVGLFRIRAERDRAVAAERLASHRLVEVERANAETKQALTDTEAAKAETESALNESEQARQVTTAVSTFLIEGIRSLDPSMGGREMDLTVLLEEAAGKLEQEFAGPPKLQGDMLSAVGTVYFGLGRHDQAIEMHIRAVAVLIATLGSDHADTLFAMNRLGGTFRQAGRLSEAIEVFEETVGRAKASFAPDHPTTLQSMNGLALAYNDSGRRQVGIPLLEDTLEKSKAALAPADPFTLTVMRNLAAAYRAAGRPADAIPLYKDIHRLRPTKLGPDHPSKFVEMFLLASAYREADRAADAVSLLEDLSQAFKATLAADHDDTLNVMEHLAWAYRDAGRLADAIELWEERLRLMKAKRGPNHVDTMTALRPLGWAYHEAGRLADSISHREELLPLMKVHVGPEHNETLVLTHNLAAAHLDAGSLARAEELFREVLAARRKTLGADHAETANGLAFLGLSLLRQKRYAEAEAFLRESLTIREQRMPRQWPTFNTRSMLGGSLAGQQKYAEAEPLLVDGYEGLRARNTPPRWLSEAFDRLSTLYADWGKPDVAAQWQTQRDQAVRDAGFIQDWLYLVGPLPPAAPDHAARLDAEYIRGEAQLRPQAENSARIGDVSVTWQTHHAGDYFLDFNALAGEPIARGVAYAVCYIIADEARKDLELKIGSDDLAKVYLNGQEVFRHAAARTLARDQDRVSGIRLNEGTNVLVFKVVNLTGEWHGCVRFVEPDGRAATGIAVRLSP